MSEKNNKQNDNKDTEKFSFSKLIRQKKFIWGTVIAVAIIIIVVIIVFATNSGSSKNNSSDSNATPTAEATKRPVNLPTTQAAATADVTTEAVTATVQPAADTPASTSDSTPAPTDNVDVDEMVDDSNTEAGIKALQMKQDTLENQETFDSYIENQNYDAAKDLLDNFFANNEYANNSLATYKNYVTYYETQGLYTDSAIYQLDYIEKNDGIENVRDGSTHYQTLMATLQNIPDFTDNRLSSIEASVNSWKEITTQLNSGDDDTVINTMKDYIKNGKESVTAYLYLTQALRSKGEHLEEAKVYYCYLGKDNSTMNQLEQSYYSMFSNMLNMLYYNDQITSDDVEYLEEEFDYENYLK